MVPIGIVTRDRIPYLDVTLRSLSATQLPADVSLTVYDDCSTAVDTRAYYSTTQVVPSAAKWPTSHHWREHGLNVISDAYVQPVGIQGRLSIVRLGSKSHGVVNASCRAICQLFQAHPLAPGVILLQDDVLFKADWYDRMLTTVANSTNFTLLPLGLLAGIKLNQRYQLPATPPLAVQSGITAQCLYISRLGFERRLAYFTRQHRIVSRFDDTLRREMTAGMLWAGCIYPFVCQHFGVQSLVRPDRKWTFATRGRIGYHAQPPYELADTVRQFTR